MKTSLALAGLGFSAAGLGLCWIQTRQARQKAEEELSAVVHLRSGQVAEWRAGRLADAAFIAESPIFREIAGRWLTSRNAAGARELLAQFKSFADHHRYRDVLLVDARGAVALALSGATGRIHNEAEAGFAAALRGREPVLTDLHDGPGGLPPHLDVISPIVGPPGSEPVGAVVLQSDARDFLYPLLHDWPAASHSAETLLVRRDGADALFLSELRYRKGSALTVRFPLSRTDSPAVMAASGVGGVVEGRDYRGVDVLAALQRVPDSPWFIVQKVDADEIFAESRRESALLLGLMSVIFVGGVGAILFLRQHNEMAEEEKEMGNLEAEWKRGDGSKRRVTPPAKSASKGGRAGESPFSGPGPAK
jgi:hypothetical protein